MPFKFEKLDVWKESVELSSIVHAVSKKFPKEELYVLTSQIRRAADSVSLNIAEGSTGQSNPEFKKFLAYLFDQELKWLAVFILHGSVELFRMRILN